MGKMLEFIPSDAAIEIKKGEAFIESAYLVGEYIKALPLTVEQNDTLVASLVDHVEIARTDAFLQGYKLCMEYQDWLEENYGGKEP